MDTLKLAPRKAQLELYCYAEDTKTLGEVFPQFGLSGFDHVIMNPPYASAELDSDMCAIWHSFRDIKPGQAGDIHLAFTEMLWRLASDDGVAAAVLPISVGTNTTKSYVKLREELLKTTGSKEFLFFDREPQSLFGEDIKTRSLILLRRGDGIGINRIRTSRLLKWTAEQRPSIFTTERLAGIDLIQCKKFIPKIGTDLEGRLYAQVLAPSHLFDASKYAPAVSRMLLSEVQDLSQDLTSRSLLVSSTAYNFVNCFFGDALPKNPVLPYSSSPINVLTFEDEETACAAFSILTSRLLFWLWHVEGDGFHVTGSFLKRAPLWAVFRSVECRAKLANYGRRLWATAQKNIVGNVNGGKQTYAFHCGHDHPEAIKAEFAMDNEFALSINVAKTLDEFVQAVVSIDGKCRTRQLDLN